MNDEKFFTEIWQVLSKVEAAIPYAIDGMPIDCEVQAKTRTKDKVARFLLGSTHWKDSNSYPIQFSLEDLNILDSIRLWGAVNIKNIPKIYRMAEYDEKSREYSGVRFGLTVNSRMFDELYGLFYRKFKRNERKLDIWDGIRKISKKFDVRLPKKKKINNEVPIKDHKLIIKPSNDFRVVQVNSHVFRFSSKQAQVFELFAEQYQKTENLELSNDFILTELELPDKTRIRDIFKKSDAWKTIIGPSKKRGYTTLILPL